MKTKESAVKLKTVHDQKVHQVYWTSYDETARKTDRMFALLLTLQWLAGIAIAFIVSPRTWSGNYSQTHFHVYAAVFLGGLLAAFPSYLIYRYPGTAFNRIVVSVSQILFSVLFIHLMGGRIEAHFHVFGSLALLAFYLDWKLLAIATVITALDHLVRGFYFPQSVYGVLYATPWRALEHAAWVLFEDIFLFISLRRAIGAFTSLAEKQVTLKETLAAIEQRVEERTAQLQSSQQTILNQQQALIGSAKMSALGEMAGGIAHEINNPLAEMKSVSSQMSELLTESPLEKSTLQEMSSSIESTVDRIAKIVQGLRVFSRDGSRDPFVSLRMSDVLENAVGLCSERFQVHGVRLTVQKVPSDLFFEGRATEISQVLLNLLNNAHDAISGFEDKWITLEALDQPNWVEIQITDSGHGISPEIRQKIFQPFFTTKEIGKGTGLGLSISLGIVKSHQGELAIDETCANTRFVLRLPKKRASTLKAA